MSATLPLSTQIGQYLDRASGFAGLAPENIGVFCWIRPAISFICGFGGTGGIWRIPRTRRCWKNWPGDLSAKASEMGGDQLLLWLEENLSNTVRVSERESVLVDSFESAADRFTGSEVSPKVLAFRTHLPKYSLRAAAGNLASTWKWSRGVGGGSRRSAAH